MKFKNRVFDGTEYTLVEIYNMEKYGDIYHFMSDTSDIFCKKIDNSYVQIKDEIIIDEIIETYNLKNPEIFFSANPILLAFNFLNCITKTKKLSSEQVKIIIDEAINKLSELKCNIDKQKFKDILRNASFYSANLENFSGSAFFHPFTNSICYSEEDISSDKPPSIRTRLHEIIHSLSGKKAILGKYQKYFGLVEGATENIVEKLYGKKMSSHDRGIRYNFSEDAVYKAQVAIIRQMEYALGMEADEDILLGKTDFFDNFAKRYGKDALRVISHRATRLTLSAIEQAKKGGKLPEFNRVEYLRETQDIILKCIFDKEFEEIHTIEDAQSYFTRLQGFETTRGKELGKEDKDFKDYYKLQLILIREKLVEKGYDQDQISDFFQEHQYKKQKFYPIYKTTLEMEKLLVDDQILRMTSSVILTELKDEQDIQNKFEEFAFYRGLKGSYDDEYREYLLSTRNGNPISMYLIKNFGDTFREYYKAKNGELDLPLDLNFVQNQDGFSIAEDDDSITRLQEAKLSMNDLKVIKCRPILTPENSQGMESLLMIAKKQRLSVINKITSKIKSAFLNSNKSQDYSMEDEQK